jgi:hypothetical protein
MKDPFKLQCDNVESTADVHVRVKSFVDDLMKSFQSNLPVEEHVLIFAHGALIKEFLIHLKSRNAFFPPKVNKNIFIDMFKTYSFKKYYGVFGKKFIPTLIDRITILTCLFKVILL